MTILRDRKRGGERERETYINVKKERGWAISHTTPQLGIKPATSGCNSDDAPTNSHPTRAHFFLLFLSEKENLIFIAISLLMDVTNFNFYLLK